MHSVPRPAAECSGDAHSLRQCATEGTFLCSVHRYEPRQTAFLSSAFSNHRTALGASKDTAREQQGALQAILLITACTRRDSKARKHSQVLATSGNEVSYAVPFSQLKHHCIKIEHLAFKILSSVQCHPSLDGSLMLSRSFHSSLVPSHESSRDTSP